MAAFLALRALWPAVAQDAPLKSETMFGTHSKFKFVWFRESFYQWLVFGSLDVPSIDDQDRSLAFTRSDL